MAEPEKVVGAGPRPSLPELQPLQLLGLAEVKSLLQVASSTIYRWIAAGTFPRPIQLAENCVRWRALDIQQWLEAKPLFSKPGMEPGIGEKRNEDKAA